MVDVFQSTAVSEIQFVTHIENFWPEECPNDNILSSIFISILELNLMQSDINGVPVWAMRAAFLVRAPQSPQEYIFHYLTFFQIISTKLFDPILDV